MFRDNPEPGLEFEIEETIIGIERLEKYYNTSFNLQRLVLARNIGCVCTEAQSGEEILTRVVPLLRHFVHDRETVVRHEVCRQLPIILKSLKETEPKLETEAFNTVVKDELVPLCVDLCVDEDKDVAEDARKGLSGIGAVESCGKKAVELLNRASIEREIESEEPNAKKLRMLKTRVASALCVLAHNGCVPLDDVLDTLLRFAQDVAQEVRASVACGMGRASSRASMEDRQTKVFPAVVNLAKDSVWAVRRAAAESLVDLSVGADPKFRSQKLAGLFNMLRRDASRWVKLAAFRTLGRFISTFPKGTVGDGLVGAFVGMCPTDVSPMALTLSTSSLSADLVDFTARDFPAVARAVGPKRWFQVEKLFLHLLRHPRWTVRRRLACALHEIAQDVSGKTADGVVGPALLQVLQDLDDVRLPAVRNASVTFAALTPGTASLKQGIRQVTALGSESNNWRVRHSVARQAGRLAELALGEKQKKQGEDSAAKLVAETSLGLLRDSTWAVRLCAAKCCGDLVRSFTTGGIQDLVEVIVAGILALCKDDKWFLRQLFVDAAESVVNEMPAEDPSAEKLAKGIISMGSEKCSNVRIRVLEWCDQAKDNVRWGADCVELHKKVLASEERSVLEQRESEEEDSQEESSDDFSI